MRRWGTAPALSHGNVSLVCIDGGCLTFPRSFVAIDDVRVVRKPNTLARKSAGHFDILRPIGEHPRSEFNGLFSRRLPKEPCHPAGRERSVPHHRLAPSFRLD